VVANVNAALGLLVEARTLGVSVPDDLSIVAIHDAWTAANAWPPLTTVRMPLYELGRVSMAAVFDRIRDGAIADVVVLDPPPELIVRESTRALWPFYAILRRNSPNTSNVWPMLTGRLLRTDEGNRQCGRAQRGAGSL
jgi:hypothetical protein